ncbi:MAG: hypothetical protein LBG06_06670 [Deltaproteobacteria bacterium]|jgi:hypothetical protein|nr:hypothetical protein [Deltaproteobacteria bacterium]
MSGEYPGSAEQSCCEEGSGTEIKERGLPDKALSYFNVRKAAEQAVRNKGAAGIGGMEVYLSLPYLERRIAMS